MPSWPHSTPWRFPSPPSGGTGCRSRRTPTSPSLAACLRSSTTTPGWPRLSDGSPVACGFCWSNSAGDQRAMECDVLVRRDRRREGIGSELFDRICASAADEDRTLLTWTTSDAVPAGEAFSRRVALNRPGSIAPANCCSPMSTGRRWRSGRRRAAREHGYRVEMVDGVFPEHLRADAATFHHIMQTAPREDLEVGDVLINAERRRRARPGLLEAGRMRWTALMRDPTAHVSGERK